jgi:phosphate-selective porin OprO/OprP
MLRGLTVAVMGLATILAVAPAFAQTATDQNSTETSQGGSIPGGSPLAVAGPAASSSPNGLAWRNDRLTLTLADGDFTLSPLVRLDVDRAMFFDQNRPNGFQTSTNARRGRLGVRGTFLQDFEYNVTWEFGGFPNRRDFLYEAQVAWNGLGWGTVRVGEFTPQHMPEFAGSSYDLPFMERAAISAIVTSLASGDSRNAVGLEARGERWNGSLYFTAGSPAVLQSNRQRGLVGRALVVAIDQPGAQIQIGFDGAAQFDAGTSPGPESIRLRDFPELRGGNANRFLDTGAIPTSSAYAIGPEVAGRIGPLYVEGVYQHVGINVTGGGSRSFEGWYVQAAVPLLGPPRERNRTTGTWVRPKTVGWIDPSSGNRGAIEAAARYSSVDLRDGPTRGGRQRIWTAGVNWYLSPNLKLQAEYENGQIDLDAKNRDFQAFGVRIALSL